MPHKVQFLRRLLQGGLALAWLLGGVPAWSEELPEYRLKAAFLYNFAALTEWPADVGATLHLCIHGADPFAGELNVLNGKTAGSRRIEVARSSTLQSLKGCQIVFVSAAAAGQLPRVLDAVRSLPVLVIADTPGALRQGAMLNMNLVQGRVTFEANLAAARCARLTLSSKLLRLATEVLQ